MKPCPYCGTENADTHKFCRRCGKALGSLPASLTAPPPDATVRWSGQLLPAGGPQRTIPVDSLFAAKRQLLIGRAPQCDIFLPHPSVSRRHALLEKEGGGLRLRDLGSVNGVLVGGRPVAEPVLL